MSDEFELWTWAVSTYARPGVAACCLRLQDEFGFDVNVALAGVWAAVESRELSIMDLEAMLEATETARRRVHDLRAIRKETKGDPLAQTFHAKLEAAELAGEKVVQRGLWLWLVAQTRPRDTTMVRPRADASLRRYAEHLGCWPAASEALRAFLDVTCP